MSATGRAQSRHRCRSRSVTRRGSTASFRTSGQRPPLNEMNQLLLAAMSSGRPRRSRSGSPSGSRRSLGDLSSSERKVARALLSGPPDDRPGVGQPAGRPAGVSGPTVSRFVSRLGFDNYAAFQQALRDDLSARVLSPVEVYRSHVGRIRPPPLEPQRHRTGGGGDRHAGQLSPPDFERAVSLLADERHRVLVTGGWTSHLLAAMLTSLVRPFRSGVQHVPSLAAERAAASPTSRGDDVVVLFDFRRYELDTFEFARLARDRGGPAGPAHRPVAVPDRRPGRRGAAGPGRRAVAVREPDARRSRWWRPW